MTSIESPCILVCSIDMKTGYCFGCGRTLPEVARWHRMESEERLSIMAELPERMRAAGLPPMSPSPARKTQGDAT